MPVTVMDWDNNTANCVKGISDYSMRDAYKDNNFSSFYDYFVYPYSKSNIKTSAFKYKLSTGDDYVTYPLEYNLTLDKYPTGWGIQEWNKAILLKNFKYSRTNSGGSQDFCPVLLEPGTVVYGGTSTSDTCKVLKFIGEDVTIERVDDFTLKINNEPYRRLLFRDSCVPKRLYITVQAAGGGGGGSQYMFMSTGMGGCGGASGAYACMILDLTAGDRIWRITGGKGGAGGYHTGTSGKHDGTKGDATYISLQVNGEWQDIATLYGGEGGLRGDNGFHQRNSIPGKIEFYNTDKKWYWCLEHSPENTDTESPGHGGTEGKKGSGISTNEMLLADNSNNMSGSKVQWPATSGKSNNKKGGGGGEGLVSGTGYFGGLGDGGNGGDAPVSSGEDGRKGDDSSITIYLLYEE